MKQLLLTAILALSGTAATAQVTLEHHYSSVDITRFSNGDVKYVVDEPASNRISLYNENHSLMRQLTVPAAPTGYTFFGSGLVSDKLFNTDNAVEYLAIYGHALPNNTYIRRACIYSETGTQLALIDSVGSSDYVFRGNTGLKLYSTIDRFDATGNYNGSYVKIFGLGGTSNPLANRATSNASEALPYPNPASERINLPYHLAAGQTAGLEVCDMAGRLVRTYTVGPAFDHLLLQAAELRAGVYTYRVRASDGTVQAGHRFIVE